MQCGRNVSQGARLWNRIWLLSYHSIIRSGCSGGKIECVWQRGRQQGHSSACSWSSFLQWDFFLKWLYRVMVCMCKRTLQHQSQRYIKIGCLKVLWISLMQRADIKLVAYLHFCKRLSDQVFRNGHDVTDVIVNILNSWLAGFCSVAPSGNVDPSVQLFPQ